ncbi:hypothetical protein D3C72_946790 [compost metagenome]
MATGGGFVELDEFLEETIHLGGINARAGIGDGKAKSGDASRRGRAVGGGGAYHQAARAGELDRVRDQIGEDLTNARLVADPGPGQTGRDFEADRQSLGGGRWFEKASDALQHRAEGKGTGVDRQLAGLDLGEVQHVVEQDAERFPGFDQQETLLLLARREVSPGQGARHADHSVERRANLVAHIGDEITLGAAGRLGQAALGDGGGLGCPAAGEGGGQAAYGRDRGRREQQTGDQELQGGQGLVVSEAHEDGQGRQCAQMRTQGRCRDGPGTGGHHDAVDQGAGQ